MTEDEDRTVVTVLVADCVHGVSRIGAKITAFVFFVLKTGRKL